MIDTKAVRALADKQANVWTPVGWEADVANTLRQCAGEIDTLRAGIGDAMTEIAGLELERDTLRELVLEILDESTLKPDWFERAEKALNNADLPG